jgi:hypothetical protein
MEKQTEILNTLEEAYGTYGSPKQKNLCERFYPKKISLNTLGSEGILRTMLKNPHLKTRTQLLEHKYNTEEGETFELDESCLLEVEDEEGNKQLLGINPYLLTDALKILRCAKLIRLDKRSYSINWELWHNDDVRYKLQNNNLFVSLAPIMVEYLRNSVKRTPNDFVKRIDPVVSYVLLPTFKHNETYKQERKVYRAMEKFEMVEIKLKDNSIVEGYPMAVKIKNENKWLEYEDGDGKKQTVPMSWVVM